MKNCAAVGLSVVRYMSRGKWAYRIPPESIKPVYLGFQS